MQETQIVAFDLDGTLTESKQALDSEMTLLLFELLKVRKAAIISGAGFPQFEKQVFAQLPAASNWDNLYILVGGGAALYRNTAGVWEEVYSIRLTDSDKARVYEALEKAFADSGFEKPSKLYGTLIEDRDVQVTFSGLGSEAPLELKQAWDPNQEKRIALQDALKKYLPEFAMNIGGTTSIDITKGTDKAYGINKLLESTGTKPELLLFVGDALYPGGNDAPVLSLGVRCVWVHTVAETKSLIRDLLARAF